MTETSNLQKLILKIKNWPHELRVAVLDWLFWIMVPLFLSLDSLVTRAIAEDASRSDLISLGDVVLFSLLLIILPAALYFTFRSKFKYKLPVLLYGSVTFMGAYLFFRMIENFNSFDNYGYAWSRFEMVYPVFYLFLYFTVVNLIFVIREYKNKAQSKSNVIQNRESNPENDDSGFKSRVLIVTLMAIVLLCAAAIIYHYENRTFMNYFLGGMFPSLIIALSLLIFYKYLFKKEVSTRQIGYVPFSIQVTFIIYFVISILSFVILDSISYSILQNQIISFVLSFVLCIPAGFIYIIFMLGLTKICLFFKNQILNILKNEQRERS
ncbi:hypothetical protein MsAg5_17280 [Methanosarcinaceae archaeon Ag5]|uniref:Uncharacterized protein n=1 Tax=Methanolapillus africanus TaxID=3028297 RepID=A0AAE4MKU9_9EURY|nr:hypothetical protein [Methanosarcinaceae archaeon Ag5]